MFGGPTLPCDWIEMTEDGRAAYFRGTEPGKVVGRAAFVDQSPACGFVRKTVETFQNPAAHLTADKRELGKQDFGEIYGFALSGRPSVVAAFLRRTSARST